MLYYLITVLVPHAGPLNAFTYHTTRAGAAAFTAFLASLILGPVVIRRLQALKVGQYIREEHVAGLHALHKGKAGTPTMGGVLILLTTAIGALLWGRLDSRLLWVALGTFCALGAVGFLDDYIKLRRKNNQGLSAKAKFAGQIVVGLLLGIYVVMDPVTPSAPPLTRGDVKDWERLAHVFEQQIPPISHDMALELSEIPIPVKPSSVEQGQIVDKLNQLLESIDFCALGTWDETLLTPETRRLIAKRKEGLELGRTQEVNRRLLDDTFPETFVPMVSNLHTKVGVPGLKEVFIPLGVGYVLFVVVMIVGSSNAVNLTDGLDGLAIGASVMSIMAYTAIAYIVSRADWSQYLFLVQVPEASELTVFGASMLGAGLGFLWFNSHPAEVFMGDTGSLALGGVIGAMAVLTKQELLLVVVGGLFVIEAASVIIQVLSYKLRGKRVFRMAPIHHHFELLGWSESKVTVRFWIVALLFALMSLATLKIR